MRLSLAQAAGTVGRSRSTVLRSIRAGKLSAERDEVTGAWSIDVAELTRLFAVQVNGHGQDDDAHGHDLIRTGGLDTLSTTLASPLAAAEARIADKDEQIAGLIADKMELNRRLDRAEEERRELLAILSSAQAQVRLLTDQRPKVPEPPTSAWGRFLAWRRGR